MEDFMSEKEFSELKVGDEIEIRSWEEMVADPNFKKEYRVIYCPHGVDFWRDEMRYLSGNTFAVDFISVGFRAVSVDGYFLSRYMLKPKKPTNINPSVFDEFLGG